MELREAMQYPIRVQRLLIPMLLGCGVAAFFGCGIIALLVQGRLSIVESLFASLALAICTGLVVVVVRQLRSQEPMLMIAQDKLEFRPQASPKRRAVVWRNELNSVRTNYIGPHLSHCSLYLSVTEGCYERVKPLRVFWCKRGRQLVFMVGNIKIAGKRVNPFEIVALLEEWIADTDAQ